MVASDLTKGAFQADVEEIAAGQEKWAPAC